jgi:transposase
MHLRDGLSNKEIGRKTGISRNTLRKWLRGTDSGGEAAAIVEPRYERAATFGKLAAFADTLSQWFIADSKRDRRTYGQMHKELVALGYAGSYGRVCAFAKRWRNEQSEQAAKAAFIPLRFKHGEAFQFDWSCEYTFIGGLRRRIELAHTKPCSSRAFWLTAYPAQGHEMLFDAHARAFAAFGGVPQRGIYDYSVDRR